MKTITQMKIEYDAAKTCMRLADKLTLTNSPIRKAKAEQDLFSAAERVENLIVAILTTTPISPDDRATQVKVWADYAELIINAESGAPFFGLHMKINHNIAA